MRVRTVLITVSILTACFIVMPAGGPLWYPMVFAQELGNKIDSQKDELEKIERDIQRHRAKNRELQREENSVVKQLSHLNKEISLSNKLVSSLREREQLLEEQIDSLRVGIVFEANTLEFQRGKLERRVRQMYKQGPSYDLSLIVGSRSINDALRRSKFLAIIAARDAKLVAEVADRKLALESEQAALTEAMSDVSMLRAHKVEEDSRLKANKQQRVTMLESIRNEQSENKKAIEALEKAQEEMRDLIAALERKRLSSPDVDIPAGEFAKLKGKLIWPVDGKLTRKFGNQRHPEFGTVTFNNGIDIGASRGAPVRAVATGKVEFVDWINGYGNCIILNHGGGYYTLYAHADQILVTSGQTVVAHDVIAEVGDSGSVGGYMCHFEIRKAKQALDPLPWLRR